jgi:hypothetical protein
MNNKRPNYYNSREWNEFSRWWAENIRKAPPSDFIREMMAHRRTTGTYRRKDLTRLLGSQRQGTTMPLASNLEAWLREHLCGKKPNDSSAGEST